MTVSASLMRSVPALDTPAALQHPRASTSAVLVLRALGLGDALTAVPALRGIRRAWPDRWILLAGDPGIGGWLRERGVVDEVLPTSGLAPLDWPAPGVIGTGGHVAVNLHGAGPESHRVLAMTAPENLIAFRQPAVGHLTGPHWRRGEHEVLRWCRLVGSAGGSCGSLDLRLAAAGGRTDEVLIHPGAAAASRRWPAPRWSRLVAMLAEGGHPVVLTGGPAERELCSEIITRARDLASRGADVRNAAGDLTLAELADAVSRAQLIVCGDTGPAHLATAYGTRSVLLFGPTSPVRWGPIIDPQLHTVLWHGTDRAPGDPHGDTVDPALDAIAVEEVIAAAAAALGDDRAA